MKLRHIRQLIRVPGKPFKLGRYIKQPSGKQISVLIVDPMIEDELEHPDAVDPGN